MPEKLTCPDQNDYLVIVSFSGEVVDQMWSKNKFPVGGKEMKIPHKPVRVAFSTVLTDCTCLGKIEGGNSNYGISLRLPTHHVRAADSDHWTRVKPFIAGIIMHEYVHCLQRQKCELKDEIEESEEAGKTCHACKTPTNYLAYYNGLIEKDALAAGITVEVMHLDNPDNPISSKNVEATMTWERIKGRLDNTEHDICNRIDENFVGELLIELTCLAEQYAELWRSET